MHYFAITQPQKYTEPGGEVISKMDSIISQSVIGAFISSVQNLERIQKEVVPYA